MSRSELLGHVGTIFCFDFTRDLFRRVFLVVREPVDRFVDLALARRVRWPKWLVVIVLGHFAHVDDFFGNRSVFSIDSFASVKDALCSGTLGELFVLKLA